MSKHKILIMGKSSSGKNFFGEALEKAGYKKIVTYTTRPQRPGEINRKDYHFISDDDFLRKRDYGFFAESAEYDTVEGRWYYGSTLEDYKNGDYIILTPKGINTIMPILEEEGIPYKIVSLFAMQTVRYKRAIDRGDNIAEISRRFEKDNEDFKEAPCADYSFDTSCWSDKDVEMAINKIFA